MRSVIDSLFLETALTSIAMEKTVGFASAPKVNLFLRKSPLLSTMLITICLRPEDSGFLQNLSTETPCISLSASQENLGNASMVGEQNQIGHKPWNAFASSSIN